MPRKQKLTKPKPRKKPMQKLKQMPKLQNQPNQLLMPRPTRSQPPKMLLKQKHQKLLSQPRSNLAIQGLARASGPVFDSSLETRLGGFFCVWIFDPDVA
ncbi:MAG: hypothetical protein ABIO88_10590 [Burkholderiaceae bacterium]